MPTGVQVSGVNSITNSMSTIDTIVESLLKVKNKVSELQVLIIFNIALVFPWLNLSYSVPAEIKHQLTFLCLN